MTLKPQQIQTIFFIAIIVIATIGMPRPKPLSIILPEGHRAYEWEWKLKFVGVPYGTPTDKIKETTISKIKNRLTKEVDERGNPLQLIGEPEVTRMTTVKTYYAPISGTPYAHDYEITVLTGFHGYFEEPEGPLAVVTTAMVLAIIYKVAPAIITAITAFIIMDTLKTIAIVVRDITTNYVEEIEYLTEDEYLTDEAGNIVLDDTGKPVVTGRHLVLDEEGNPIVISRRTSRTSTIGEWMPWLTTMIIVVAIAFVVAFVVPSLIGVFGSKRRRR